MSIVALVMSSVSICGASFDPPDIATIWFRRSKEPSVSESDDRIFSDRDRLALELDESVTLEANDQITNFPER